MSYLVSQLRKNSSSGSNDYMTAVTVQPGTAESPNTFGQSTTFTDFRLAGTFIKGKVYYLRFKVQRIPYGWYQRNPNTGEIRHEYPNADDLRLTILLKNALEMDEQTDMPQQIGTCVIYKSEKDYKEYSSFVYVFSPLRNFDSIVFRIQRDTYDAIRPDGNTYRNWLREEDEDDNLPRIFYSGENGQVSELNNILDFTDSKSTKWLKFGFQSRPGVLIVVNGQPIRVGRSGIYECNNGMQIESFMIASPGGTNKANIDAFLLDYAYNG